MCSELRSLTEPQHFEGSFAIVSTPILLIQWGLKRCWPPARTRLPKFSRGLIRPCGERLLSERYRYGHKNSKTSSNYLKTRTASKRQWESAGDRKKQQGKTSLKADLEVHQLVRDRAGGSCSSGCELPSRVRSYCPGFSGDRLNMQLDVGKLMPPATAEIICLLVSDRVASVSKLNQKSWLKLNC